MGLAIERVQYHDLLAIASALSDQETTPTVKGFRDSTDEDRDMYVMLYRHKFHGYEALSAADNKLLQRLESELSYDTIAQYRFWAIQVAALELGMDERELQMRYDTASTAGAILSTFTSLFSGEQQKNEVTAQQLKAIYSGTATAADFQHPSDKKVPKEYVNMAINLHVRQATFALLKPQRSGELVSVVTKSMRVEYLTRLNNFLVKVDVDSIEAMDYATPNTQFPHLMRSIAPPGSSQPSRRPMALMHDSAEGSRSSSFIHVEFETLPFDLGVEADNKLVIRAAPMEIAINPKLVEQIMIFLKPPPVVDLQPLIEFAELAVRKVKE